MDDTVARAYAAASGFLVESVERVPRDAWDAPGLGSWSVRELVGHANRAHTLPEEYLRRPVAAEEPGSPYFAEEAIAERGRLAVAALGQDPAAAVRAASASALELITTTRGDAVLGTPFGAQTLAGYLPSRTAELTIHALDLQTALGIAQEPPAEALAASLAFVAARAASRSGARVLLALSGRATLPEGYSVY